MNFRLKFLMITHLFFCKGARIKGFSYQQFIENDNRLIYSLRCFGCDKKWKVCK